MTARDTRGLHGPRAVMTHAVPRIDLVPLTTAIPAGLRRQLKDAAQAAGVTLQSFIATTLAEKVR